MTRSTKYTKQEKRIIALETENDMFKLFLKHIVSTKWRHITMTVPDLEAADGQPNLRFTENPVKNEITMHFDDETFDELPEQEDDE